MIKESTVIKQFFNLEAHEQIEKTGMNGSTLRTWKRRYSNKEEVPYHVLKRMCNAIGYCFNIVIYKKKP